MPVKDNSHREPFLPNLCRLSVVLGLVLISELLVIVFVLAASPLSTFDWQQFSLLSLYVLWVCLLSIAGLCMARNWLNDQGETIAAFSSFGWVMLVLLVTNTFAQWVYHAGDVARWRVLWLLRDGFICAVLAGIGLRYLYMHQRWKNQNKAMLQAQFAALQARIKPHFLFNSMNTIASLIHHEPRAAEKAVEDLSALFRVSLAQSAGKQLIAWRSEIQTCEAYLRIEQQRLGERLSVIWTINDDEIERQLPDFKLPALTIQPLIENAIYHGIETLPQGGQLQIIIDCSAEGLHVQVSNPIGDSLTPREPSVAAGHGIALDNIRQRLAVLYADKAHLSLSLSDDKCLMQMCIPILDSSNWS